MQQKLTRLLIIVALFNVQCFAQGTFDPSAFNPSERGVIARGDKSASLYIGKLRDVFNYVQKNYVDEVDAKVLYEGALKGMLEALGDPYTLYLDNDSMRSMTDTTAGNFGGVGLSISKQRDATSGDGAYVEVVSPIEGKPGALAGIHSGDLIVSIDGDDTAKMTMENVLNHLRGPVGTSVTVHIKRSERVEFDVSLTRAIIEVPTAKYDTIYDKGQRIGYVRLIEFTPDTPHRLQDALDSFFASRVSGIVLDLRDNPGGLITSAVAVVDKFIDEGPIVSTKSRLKFENSMYSATKKATTVPESTPVVVLLNRGSASASEIVAGALKDYHKAYIVGQRSYGKGSVQKVIPLSNSDGFKITMARYYSPSDTNIDKIGIPPDKEVLFPEVTEEQEKAYSELMEADAIHKYVKAHPAMSESDITSFADTLQKTYPLGASYLRRLVRMDVHRADGGISYDLDYDVQLNAALEIIRQGGFQQLVHNTKTLRELQEEAAAGAVAAGTTEQKE